MGRSFERTRLQAITDRRGSLSQNPSNGATSTDLNLPTEVCTGTAKTKERSQRRAFNLIPIMVFNDRPTCKDRHAAELIMARRHILHSKAEYIAADLSIRSEAFPLQSCGGPYIVGTDLAHFPEARFWPTSGLSTNRWQCEELVPKSLAR
jgi:hypothetical protein